MISPGVPWHEHLPSCPGEHRRGGFRAGFRSKIAMIAGLTGLAIIAGCAAKKDPSEATISWLTAQTRAAKPADCPIAMRTAMPNADYEQIAIVEVSADYNASDQEVRDLARRKGCETGADALVVLADQRQKHGDPLPGTSADEGKDIGPGSGINLQQRKHEPEVGELGHQGRYLNAAAIIYRSADAAR
jgi:hypothetical protein